MKRINKEEVKYYRKLNSNVDFKYNMRSAIAFTLTPCKEGIGEMVEYYGEAWVDPTQGIYTPEYVYILVNPSVPGICKIGYTSTTIYDRLKQINSSPGIILPWYSVFVYKCPNGYLLEKDIHNYLEKQGLRVNPNREGFEINSNKAIQIIEELGEKYQTI